MLINPKDKLTRSDKKKGVFMNIDRDKINKLASLPDDKLWAEIVKMAGGFGFNLPKEVPSHDDMRKLREAVTGQKINLTDAYKLLKAYKKEGRR